MKKKSGIFNAWKYILGAFLIVLYLLPFYVVLNVALKAQTDLSSRLSLPVSIYWENFKGVISSGAIFVGIRNTLIITTFVMLIEILFGCMAGYALARNQTKLNEFVRMLIMAVMMVTPLSILVGVYSTMSKIGGISTYWGIVFVLSSFGLPLSVLLYTNFISAIPPALDEAAAIDGASYLQIFFHIILPQLKPVTVSVLILRGVSSWNEYTYCYYFLQKSGMETATLVIKSYFSTVVNDYGGAAAAAVIAMLPLVILYLFMQKYFIQSTVDSALK